MNPMAIMWSIIKGISDESESCHDDNCSVPLILKNLLQSPVKESVLVDLKYSTCGIIGRNTAGCVEFSVLFTALSQSPKSTLVLGNKKY